MQDVVQWQQIQEPRSPVPESQQSPMRALHRTAPSVTTNQPNWHQLMDTNAHRLAVYQAPLTPHSHRGRAFHSPSTTLLHRHADARACSPRKPLLSSFPVRLLAQEPFPVDSK